jgi:hypothetical protein
MMHGTRNPERITQMKRLAIVIAGLMLGTVAAQAGDCSEYLPRMKDLTKSAKYMATLMKQTAANPTVGQIAYVCREFNDWDRQTGRLISDINSDPVCSTFAGEVTRSYNSNFGEMRTICRGM